MSLKRSLKYVLYLITIALVFLLGSGGVHAETKSAAITYKEKAGDLAVMFTFDKKEVDITFISPSGARKRAGDADVEYATGGLWSTYRIKDAEEGDWSVEYDLGVNSQISYSIIEDNYGLWIQYFNVSDSSNGHYNFAFEADFENDDIYYDYEIFAVSTTDSELINKIAEGSARANEEAVTDASLEGLPGDSYVFRLDVFYTEGEAEAYDTASSKIFDYTNPQTPAGIDDFVSTINMDTTTCSVDWTDFAGWGSDAYKLIATADGENVYSAELESNTTTDSFLFPEGAGSLEIKLAFRDGAIWSAYKTKTIDLQKTKLTNVSGEVTGSSQLRIGYSVEKESPLNVIINEEEGNYSIRDSGELSFDLVEGTNTVKASLECDDLIKFVIDTEVYYDATAPEITLFDDLDGKTFFSDSIKILGKTTGANILKIAGKEAKVDEDGSFSYDVELNIGENVVEIEAEDANGNSSSRVLTLYKGSSLLSKDNKTPLWARFLPLAVSGFTSLLIIILSAIFMRKRENNAGPKRGGVLGMILLDIAFAMATGICTSQFLVHFIESNSIHFVEMAEHSASEAVEYMRMERLFGIAAIVFLLLLILSIIFTVLVIGRNNRMRDE